MPFLSLSSEPITAPEKFPTTPEKTTVERQSRESVDEIKTNKKNTIIPSPLPQILVVVVVVVDVAGE